MKIIHLGNSDKRGGAAKASYRLHRGLLNQEIDSGYFVEDKTAPDNRVFKYKKKGLFNRFLSSIRNKIINRDFAPYSKSLDPHLESFSDDRSPKKFDFYLQLPKADIYNLHWISGFIDMPSFFRKIDKPVVWTLHDMYAFTGGCHYDNFCGKYTQQCGACPLLGSKKENDLSRAIWKRKQIAYSHVDPEKFKIVTDSYWLEKEAKKSSLLKHFDIQCIHYGLDTEIYKPLNKQACKEALEIPANKKVVLFGAPDITNHRKGYQPLVKAIKKLEQENSGVFLLTFGSGQIHIEVNYPQVHLGPITNERLLTLVYNAADVFVIPSIQEAFGQTSLEAMACGIPVAGFNTGGISDMIEPGVTGFLADLKNVGQLKNAIEKIINAEPEYYNNFSKHCRKKVLQKFTLKKQAEQYSALYQDLLER